VTAPEPLAVVDVGSNSIRLFLCEGVDAAGPHGPRTTTVTGLRGGAAPDGTIAPAALDRLTACLVDYGATMRAAGVTRGMALGTSAVRDAPNRDAVEALLLQHLGLSLTVLAGDEEARLAYAGARLAVPGADPVIVLDIGGGSTEFVRGDAGGPSAAISTQMGAVRFTDRFLAGDPPTSAQISDLRQAAREMAAGAVEELGGAAPLVGVAGTITTLAAVMVGAYDPSRVHGARLSRDDVEGLAERLGALTVAARRQVPGLEPARAPVIVAGAHIAACAMHALGANEMLVSERDLLDGAALDADALSGPVR
jgi:exopolyphosphatase / guanosine-5'-triphosphate,3'-diphosphate pyrophosphatase